MIKDKVNVEEQSDTQEFAGVGVKIGAKVFLHPSFGVTRKEILDKISGNNKISKRSTLYLEGRNTQVKDLDLDGTLFVSGGVATGKIHNSKFITFEPSTEQCKEFYRIRGFRVQ